MAAWSLLPKDILELIASRFDTCFEIVHFRSVCSSWWSALPPQVNLGRLGHNTLLPIFNDNPRFEGDKHCTLIKIPVFLLRFETPFGADYLLTGMRESKSGKQSLVSPLENDRVYKYRDGVTLNTLSSQIISLGHCYKVKFYAITETRHRTRRESWSKRVAFLPMGSEEGGDFAVIAGVLGDLMMYRSCDKKWTNIEGRFKSYVRDMVSFKGKFYVVDTSRRGHVFVIDPSFEVTEISKVTKSHGIFAEILVISGQELLLLQRITPGKYGDEHMHSWFRLFRLEEEGQRRWVRVNDLEDRVVFIGIGWNLCYSAKELPGMKGNCIVFIDTHEFERVFVFDLETRRTSKAVTECKGYMGALGENEESLMYCGILMNPNPGVDPYDSSSDFE